MNSFIKSVAVAAALVVPAVCFAQTAPQAAAAQNAAPDEYVVVQYEEVDYVPTAAQNQPAMPAQPHQIKPADTSGVGGVAGASSQSGAAAFNPNDNIGLNSIYQHN